MSATKDFSQFDSRTTLQAGDKNYVLYSGSDGTNSWGIAVDEFWMAIHFLFSHHIGSVCITIGDKVCEKNDVS